MAGPGIVQEYAPPTSPTLTLDQKIQREIEKNGIERPKGYTVSWHNNAEVENHHFGKTHPMKPWRLTLTKHLVMAYGMHTAMDCYLSRSATKEELAEFHQDDYLDFLQRINPNNMLQFTEVLKTFNIGEDCPIFDGLYPYCALYSGASMDAARKLLNNQSQIAINWSGGLHHAKKSEASGFCYMNDIVLAILQLLRYHPRVLYIDIDVHHGDGVEQAFWSSDRVMTLSFHKYDKKFFFPGTGPLHDTGPRNPMNPGFYHSVNVPLNDGIEDADYIWLFKEIVGPCVETYRPSALVLQCGGDSLGCDRLGCFNLNIRAHGECVNFVKGFQIPLLVLGGGGYTPRNVARLWAHETSICIGASETLSPTIPSHTPTLKAFAKEGPTLFPALEGKLENKNSREYLNNLVIEIKEHLRYLKGAPSVQLQEIPPDLAGLREEVEREIQEEKDATDAVRREREKGVGRRGEMLD
ncbi:MAG: histone deacetylase [Chaenotheca gracillima]|nr:MAG: histone deacetylase [Chaenotheca gracillima]